MLCTPLHGYTFSTEEHKHAEDIFRLENRASPRTMYKLIEHETSVESITLAISITSSSLSNPSVIKFTDCLRPNDFPLTNAYLCYTVSYLCHAIK